MSRNKKAKTVIGIAVITAAVLYLLYEAFSGSSIYYYTVDEFFEDFLTKQPQNSSAETAGLNSEVTIRLAGRVADVAGNPENLQLNFNLTSGSHRLPVEYTGRVPANFEPGRQVLVQGRMRPDGVFGAEKILTRCASKYRAKSAAAADTETSG